MTTAKGIAFPMASNTKLSIVDSDSVTYPTIFKFIVGALQYATVTRSEIFHAMIKVC